MNRELPDRCWAEIDLQALRHNVEWIRDKIGDATGIIAVVKANAYGHGAAPVAKELHRHVEAFAVANLTEAREVRRAVPQAEVLLLGAALEEERNAVVQERFIPSISSVEEARAYSLLAEGQPVEVELVIDTGMGRMGVPADLAAAALKELAALPSLRVKAVATHLPAADCDAEFTTAQIEQFEAHIAEWNRSGLFNGPVHYHNSAGLVAHFHGKPDRRIRVGLILYGIAPPGTTAPELEPVLTWKSRVLLVRTLPSGHGVSYGRTHVTSGDTVVATLSVGYADGYPIQLSNRNAQVLIRGTRCPVLGRVTMDQIMVDVSHLDSPPEPGAEVVLIGRQGDERISAEELAHWADSIPWSILSGLGRRVIRRYLYPTIYLADTDPFST